MSGPVTFIYLGRLWNSPWPGHGVEAVLGKRCESEDCIGQAQGHRVVAVAPTNKWEQKLKMRHAFRAVPKLLSVALLKVFSFMELNWIELNLIEL